MMDIFTSSRQDAATSSASASAPAPLLPIIFCGPGSNLYPLCDPSSSSSSSTTESLPKAILPVANRPLIAYPLQHLVSAGFKRVLVVAPSTQHRAIEVALKSLRLQVPHISEGKTTGGAKDSSKAGANAADETNIAVVDGLSAAVTSKAAAAPFGANVAMRVELIPLGPYDVKGASEIKDDQGQRSDQLEFRRVARPGTAELLRWLAHIGKLEVSIGNRASRRVLRNCVADHARTYLYTPSVRPSGSPRRFHSSFAATVLLPAVVLLCEQACTAHCNQPPL